MLEHLRKSIVERINSLSIRMKFLFFRGLEICQLKTDIESNFSTVEQEILEMPVRFNLLSLKSE